MTESPALPDPLVPAHVDLRGYDFMPLYGEFLRRSGFNCRVTDAEFRAGLNLWWSSWWQLPASSLPNNDDELCKLADLGRDLRTWRKVKHGALSGFVLCSDNRLYHSFLSVIARETFAKRKSAQAKASLGGKQRWKNKALTHAPSTTSSIATSNASSTSTGSPSSIENPCLADANRSKGIYPPTPLEDSTSKPRPESKAVAKTQQLLAEQREAAQRAAPEIPEEIRSKFVKPPPKSFDDIET